MYDDLLKTGIEKITRAKIQLYDKQPFFSYILNHMKAIPFNKEQLEGIKAQGLIPTMGVNAIGDLFYSEEYVMSIPNERVEAVLCHEAMHCALLHMIRLENRDMKLFNIATDLVINNMLRLNDFNTEGFQLLPDYDNSFKIGNKLIKDIDKKTAEVVYNELYEIADKIPTKSMGSDIHYFGEPTDSNGNRKSKEEIEGEWKQELANASYFAKNKGKLSASLERAVNGIIKSKLNWKQLLYRYITNEIKNDYSYRRPSKKFISTGIYFPSIANESISISCAIDTSGSISNRELNHFLGEIYSITKAHKNVELEILFHDTEISSKHLFKHNNMHNVLKVKPTGGGGTSHIPVFEYINKSKPNLFVSFTDGYSDIDECKKYNKTIFVLTTDKYKPTFGKTIQYEKLMEKGGVN